MKSFVKFLITIFVLGLIGYLIYFVAFMTTDTDVENDITSVLISGESGEVSNSGDISGDLDNQSGELSGDVIEINPKTEIDAKVLEIESGEITNTLDSELEPNVVGIEAKDYMDYFNVSTLKVSANLKEGKIEIIPYNDFLSNQAFYFDEHGKLILYEKISTTVGGSSKYYFKNDVNISIEHNYDEPSLTITNEDSADILFRARYMYTKFLAK